MARKQVVLVTGASGYVAAQLLPDLRRRYALRLVDIRATDGRGHRVPGVVVADLRHPDRSHILTRSSWFRTFARIVR